MKILRTCIITLCLFLGTTFTGQAQIPAAPRVWSMTANQNPRTVNTIAFTVTFSEAVTGVDVSDFATAGDSQYASISHVAPTDRADTYVVEVTLSIPSAQLALTLFDDDTIHNTADVPLGGVGRHNGNAISAAVTPPVWATVHTTAPAPSKADTLSRTLPRSIVHQMNWHSSVAIISPSTPVFSYFDASNADLKLAICNGDDCSNPQITTVDSTGSVGMNNSLALTTANIPVISYNDSTNNNLKLAVCDTTMCSNPRITTIDSNGSIGSENALALTTANIPIIAYADVYDLSLKLCVCDDTACASSITYTVDNSVSSMREVTSISIAIGSTNIPVISYYDNAVHKLTVCDNSACTTSHIIAMPLPAPATSYGSFTSVALTSADIPVTLLGVSESRIALAVCDDAACAAPVVSVLGIANAGGQIELALTNGDLPMITYYETYAQDLKLAACSDANCSQSTIFTVDSAGDVGLYSSLALTSANIPVISYLDSTNFNIKLYHPSSTTIDQGQPNSFAKSSPTVDQIITSATTTLTWAASTYADSYEYCYGISTADNMTCASSGTATTASISGLTDGSAYTWQVRATNTSGAMLADNGTYGAFTVSLPPGAFAKTAPTANKIITTTTTTLTWAASTRATSYQYCYATSEIECTGVEWISTEETTASISGLTDGAKYYWQVRAINTAGTTYADSNTFRSFTVTLPVPPGAFAKLTPPGPVTIIRVDTTTLTWAASTGATSYQYCYATSATCAEADWKNAGAETTARISNLTGERMYYWKVRASNTAGTTVADSNTFWTFIVRLPPGAFAKLKPANNGQKLSTNVILAWEASTRATKYEYCLRLINQLSTNCKWNNTTALSAVVTGLDKGKTYYWQVRAISPSGTTVSQPTEWKFTTAP